MSSENGLNINLRYKDLDKILVWIISRDCIEGRFNRISAAIILFDESFINAKSLLKIVFTSYFWFIKNKTTLGKKYSQNLCHILPIITNFHHLLLLSTIPVNF